jgi:hypothetical protein
LLHPSLITPVKASNKYHLQNRLTSALNYLGVSMFYANR